MGKFKVQAEVVPNQDCRLYHTNFRLCTGRLGKMLESVMLESEEKELGQASDAAKKLLHGVLGISGINTVSMTGYQMQVTKAPLFDWTEIEPQIIGLIQMVGEEMVGEQVEHVEKPIWEFQKWGLNADGTRRRRDSLFEDVFDDA